MVGRMSGREVALLGERVCGGRLRWGRRRVAQEAWEGWFEGSACMGLEVRFRRLRGKSVEPSYAHAGDAGLDLCAAEEAELRPGERALVATGIAIELAAGTEGQVRPLSGLALRYGVTVLNAPGTIDEGYRGEIGVILVNHGTESFKIRPGMRIAQMVVARRLAVDVVRVEELGSSERGGRGFGSSGLGRGQRGG